MLLAKKCWVCVRGQLQPHLLAKGYLSTCRQGKSEGRDCMCVSQYSREVGERLYRVVQSTCLRQLDNQWCQCLLHRYLQGLFVVAGHPVSPDNHVIFDPGRRGQWLVAGGDNLAIISHPRQQPRQHAKVIGVMSVWQRLATHSYNISSAEVNVTPIGPN